MFHIPIGVFNGETDEIHREEIQIARDGHVREIISKLDAKYPGSCIQLNNKLYQLQDDDVVDDVFEEGDVLTAVKSKCNQDRAVVKNNSGDVVVLMDKNKQPIFVEPKNDQEWKWNPLNFFPTITVFRKQYEDEERKLEKRIEGELVFVGHKYQIPRNTTHLKIEAEGVFQVEGETLSEIPKTGEQITKSEFVLYEPAGRSMRILFKNNGLEDFFVINGKKFNFDSYLIPRGESKMIKLRPDSREKHEFGVAPAVNTEGVPVGSREFPATMFDLPRAQGGKMVRIDGNMGGPTTTVTLVKANNQELPLKRVGTGPLQFSEIDNFNKLDLINWIISSLPAVALAVVGVDPDKGL